jgi:hypothetical protein
MFIGESSENLRRLRHAAQIDTIPLRPETRANPDHYAFGHSVNRTAVAVIINQNLPAGGNAGPHLAHAKCSQHRATGGDVVLHEGFECLNDAMNCLRRLKSEAVGELFVRRGVFGLGLIL